MLRILSFIITIVMVIASAFGCETGLYTDDYYTDSKDDYGKYQNTAELPEFFPKNLDGLTVNSYGYRDMSFGDSSYEIFLCVTVPDEDAFYAMIDKGLTNSKMKVHTAAFYNSEYMEIIFEDSYLIYEDADVEDTYGELVGAANIAKIIYSEKTKCIVYEYLLVDDTGIYYVDDIMYFNFFSITESDYVGTNTVPDI